MKINAKILIAVVALAGIGVIGGVLYFSTDKAPQTTSLPVNYDNKVVSEIAIQEPNKDMISKAEEAIKTFMASPNLTFRYITVQKNPSNFTVGKTTVIDDGAIRIDTPPEWYRPVYIIQQKEYINDRCEVYEYEVSVKTNQVIEIHVKYPEEIQDMLLGSNGLNASKCENFGSMEIPLKPREEIEKTAMDFLERNISNFGQIKSRLVYISSKKGAANPEINEWKWEDKSYKIPEGLSGDLSYPTIRVILSSGGRLVYYFNSSNLFSNQ